MTTQLALAAATFAAIHLLVSGTRLRDALVARLGELRYRGLFSLASAATLGWLIWAYAQARQPALTALTDWRVPGSALVLVAFVFIVLGLLTPGPTLVGAERLLARGVEARGIHRVTRHPFLWGVAVWAVIHMMFNPETANLLFFGAFAVVAVAGTFSIDAKRARLFGEGWQRYAAQTSNIPFAAVVQGRNRFIMSELGWLKLAAAFAAYAAFAWLHPRFFGLPPF